MNKGKGPLNFSHNSADCYFFKFFCRIYKLSKNLQIFIDIILKTKLGITY